MMVIRIGCTLSLPYQHERTHSMKHAHPCNCCGRVHIAMLASSAHPHEHPDVLERSVRVQEKTI